MQSIAASSSTGVDHLGGKYLTVLLHQECYGLPVLKVREILRLTKITPVAQMPDYVRGVMNLRGSVVPVIDLRTRFGLAASSDEHTCIVIVRIKASEREIPLGLVVDAVEEVVQIDAEHIQATPQFGTLLNPDYLVGLAKVKGGVKLLLDVDQVVAASAAASLTRAA